VGSGTTTTEGLRRSTWRMSRRGTLQATLHASPRLQRIAEWHHIWLHIRKEFHAHTALQLCNHRHALLPRSQLTAYSQASTRLSERCTQCRQHTLPIAHLTTVRRTLPFMHKYTKWNGAPMKRSHPLFLISDHINTRCLSISHVPLPGFWHNVCAAVRV
jgi:hypothetical protein